MKIAIISDCRKPTLLEGMHGLGRSVTEIAYGLHRLGHEITIFAAPQSKLGFCKVRHYKCKDEKCLERLDFSKFDVILDNTHQHCNVYDVPTVHRICDTECRGKPKIKIINSPWMKKKYGGILINTGIRANIYPIRKKKPYLLFAGKKQDNRKNYRVALQVSTQTNLPLKIATNLKGKKYWQMLGEATALLHPSKYDAAPRTPLEAAVIGTPTLVFNNTGNAYHVKHKVSGYICESVEEMVERIKDLKYLKFWRMRQWVIKEHNYLRMVKRYNAALVYASGILA